MLDGVHVDVLFLLLLKEVVTCRNEAFPHVVAVFLHYGTDGLPLLLHLDELVGGLLPVGGVHEGLGALTQVDLLGQVGAEFLLHVLVELGLLGKELVAGLAETCKQRGIGFA